MDGNYGGVDRLNPAGVECGPFCRRGAVTARHFGMPPLLIGMVIVGFGTSAPEMVVSALSSMQGNPGIALGNAYGSNITNIALILGITALVSPIKVHSQVLRKELPCWALSPYSPSGRFGMERSPASMRWFYCWCLWS